MRLIDADALKKKAYDSELWSDAANGFHQMVVDIETIDDAPTIEPTQEWIPCSERLPAVEDRVICQTRTKKGSANIIIGYYDGERWCCGMNSNVEAWRPLPAEYCQRALETDCSWR